MALRFLPWKSGDYLMTDEVTGFKHYASEMQQQWDGAWVHNSDVEYDNPQRDIRLPPEVVINGPVIRPGLDPNPATNDQIGVVGDTGVPVLPYPGYDFLFNEGVAAWRIGYEFEVQ